jgi:hypothetical protein
MPLLPHYSNFGNLLVHCDVIYKQRFEVIFSIDGGDILSSSLSEMTHNYMLFNENYDTKNNVYHSFEILNKYIGKPIGVKIKFLNKEGDVMFYFKIHDFCFTGYSNFFNLSYKEDDIRHTKVLYTCSGFEYFNENDIKKVRMNKISEIFDEKRSPVNIIKIDNLFE